MSLLIVSPPARAFFFRFHPQPWSPNIWRIQFILNYKRLRYRTKWIEFPDVERTLRHLEAPPSAMRSDGHPIYTLPVLVDPNTHIPTPRILSNANHIAEYLESTYPARPVFPEGSRALQTLFVHFIQEVFSKPLLPIMIPVSHQQMPEHIQMHTKTFEEGALMAINLGDDADTIGAIYAGLAVCWHAAEEGKANRVFWTFVPGHGPPGVLVGPQREVAWQAVREQFDFLSVIMDKNTGDGDGIVAMGHDATYADFSLCAVLIWIERMAAHDGWARVRTWNGSRWHRLWERCREYMDEC